MICNETTIQIQVTARYQMLTILSDILELEIVPLQCSGAKDFSMFYHVERKTSAALELFREYIFWSWSIKQVQQKQLDYFPDQDANRGISGHNLVAGNIDDCPSSFVFFGFIIVNEPPKCLVIIKMCPNTHRTQSNLNQSIIKQKILWKDIEKRMPPHVTEFVHTFFIFPNKNLRWKLVSYCPWYWGTFRAKWTNTIMSSPGLHITQESGSSQY